jgi:hypothetical protein
VAVANSLPQQIACWDRKVRVALQWTLDVLFSKDVTQYLTVHAPIMSREDAEDMLPVGKRFAAD